MSQLFSKTGRVSRAVKACKQGALGNNFVNAWLVSSPDLYLLSTYAMLHCVSAAWRFRGTMDVALFLNNERKKGKKTKDENQRILVNLLTLSFLKVKTGWWVMQFRSYLRWDVWSYFRKDAFSNRSVIRWSFSYTSFSWITVESLDKGVTTHDIRCTKDLDIRLISLIFGCWIRSKHSCFQRFFKYELLSTDICLYLGIASRYFLIFCWNLSIFI